MSIIRPIDDQVNAAGAPFDFVGGSEAWECLDLYDDTKYVKWAAGAAARAQLIPSANIDHLVDPTPLYWNVRIKLGPLAGGVAATGALYLFLIADDGSVCQLTPGIVVNTLANENGWTDSSIHPSNFYTSGPPDTIAAPDRPAFYVQYVPQVAQTQEVYISHFSFGDAEVGSKIVTVSSDANSAWDEEGAVEVPFGGDLTVTLTPASGYHVDDVLVDDVSVGDAHGDPSYELVLSDVITEHTVVGSAEGDPVVIVPETPIGDPTEATGTIRVDNTTPIVGETVRFTVRPSPGRKIGQLKRDNVSIAAEINPIYGVSNQTRMDVVGLAIELDEVIQPDGGPVIAAQFVQGPSGVPVSSYVNGFQAGFGLEDFAARTAAEERHRGLPKSS